MSATTAASNITAPTQFIQAKSERYAYRRFGGGPRRPLLRLLAFLASDAPSAAS